MNRKFFAVLALLLFFSIGLSPALVKAAEGTAKAKPAKTELVGVKKDGGDINIIVNPPNSNGSPNSNGQSVEAKTLALNIEVLSELKETDKSIDRAISLLKGVITLIAVMVGIAGLLGYRQEKSWRDLREKIEKKADDMDGMVKNLREREEGLQKVENELERRAGELKKSGEELRKRTQVQAKMLEEVEQSAEQIKKHEKTIGEQSKILEVLVKEKVAEKNEEREGLNLPTKLTEEVPEEEKKKLDSYARKFDTLEGLGVELSAEDYYNRGLDFYYDSFFDKAIEAFGRATELRPDDVDAWFSKGVTLNMKGLYGEAIEAYDRVLDLRPDNALAWSNKGAALADEKLYDEAIRACDRAIDLKPNFANALSNKGVALAGKGLYDEAIRVHNRAVELKSGNADAWFNRGCAYALKGEKTEALVDLKEAIRLDSKIKEDAKTDDDFKSLWEDEEFKKLVK